MEDQKKPARQRDGLINIQFRLGQAEKDVLALAAARQSRSLANLMEHLARLEIRREKKRMQAELRQKERELQEWEP